MIGQTISHYHIIEKLGEVPIRPAKQPAGRLDLASIAMLSPLVELWIPRLFVGSCNGGDQ
jgi:hypothetical protein